MKSSSRFVGMGATALAWLVGVGAASSAGAQSASAPYFYLWGPPEPGVSGPAFLQHASQMVRIYADSYDGALAAWHAANKARTQIDNEVTDPNHICLVLENFGAFMGGANTHNGFLQVDDPIVPQPVWSGSHTLEMEVTHPWMTSGRARARQWMEEFIHEYKIQSAALNLPAPARFHFDSEIGFVGSWEVNHTRIIEGWTQDPRWDSPYGVPGLPVPGSADYLVPSGGVDKTMRLLYEEAKSVFDWNSAVPLIDPNPNIPQAMDRTLPPQDHHNRKYYVWLGEIMTRAIDANMKYCAYDVIKAANNYPNCKVSNYGYATMDGNPDTFGWHTSRDPSMAPVTPQNPTPPPYSPQRMGVRGAPHYGQDSGTWQYWNDFVDSNTQRPSFWSVAQGVASGDFSCPVIYPPHPQHYFPSTIFKNYYLPLVGNPLDWQNITAAQAAITYGRRWMESAIHTPGGDHAKIVPWIPSLGAIRNQLYTWQPNDMRDLLAMLRAKKTQEMILWWNNPSTAPAWLDIEPIIDRVYQPQLDYIRILVGNCANCPPPPAPIPVNRLKYTLREQDSNDEYVDVNSVIVGDRSQAVVQLRFANMGAQEIGTAALNLECTVDAGLQGSINEFRGQIYVRNWTTNQWLLQNIVDDYGAPDGEGFGFFAPVYEELPNRKWYETRRTFDNLQKFVNSSGQVEIKIVLQRTQTSYPFTARFDLAQLVGVPNATSSMSQAQGADFNHTQEVSTEDITGFYAAYTAGEASADFNNDEVVDAQDLAEYTLEYVNPK